MTIYIYYVLRMNPSQIRRRWLTVKHPNQKQNKKLHNLILDYQNMRNHMILSLFKLKSPKLGVICTAFKFKCYHLKSPLRMSFSRNLSKIMASTSAIIYCRRRLKAAALFSDHVCSGLQNLRIYLTCSGNRNNLIH